MWEALSKKKKRKQKQKKIFVVKLLFLFYDFFYWSETSQHKCVSKKEKRKSLPQYVTQVLWYLPNFSFFFVLVCFFFLPFLFSHFLTQVFKDASFCCPPVLRKTFIFRLAKSLWYPKVCKICNVLKFFSALFPTTERKMLKKNQITETKNAKLK